MSVSAVPVIDDWDVPEDPEPWPEVGDGAEAPSIPVELADRAAASWVRAANRIDSIDDRAAQLRAELNELAQRRLDSIELWAASEKAEHIDKMRYAEQILTYHSREALAASGWKVLTERYPAGAEVAYRAGRGTLTVDDEAALAEWCRANNLADAVTTKEVVDKAAVKKAIIAKYGDPVKGDPDDQVTDLPGAHFKRSGYRPSVERSGR